MAAAFNLITAEWINAYLAHHLSVDRVRAIFRASVKRGYQVPDDSGCGRLAWRITYIRETKDREAENRKLVQQGRAFLKTFAAIRAQSKEDPRWERLADEIDDLLIFFEHEEIHVVARWALEAWAAANHGKYPRSIEPSAPLCKVVSAVLGEAGTPLSPSSVSAVLKGKRRQHEK
jgi:hypothetical protein